jgi:hypothetical protein
LANEIWHSYEEGLTLYALIWRKTDDKIYDAVAGSGTFDTYTDADIDDYDVALTNHVDSDYYSADFPSGIASGTYRIQIMRQVGGSIDADADIAVAQGEFYWDGTTEIDLTTISAQVGQVHQVEDTLPGGGGTSVSASGIAEGC